MKEAKLKVLVVEDQSIIAKHIDVCLKQFGHETIGPAFSGEEAVRLADTQRPDLVLMDIVLKGPLDGIDAAEQIRSRFNIPVLFLTAHSDKKTLDRAKITQPYGYLLKPFGERELYAAIEMAFHKHHQEKILQEKNSWFSSTLASIGDAVIATDKEEKVTFLNPVAQYLTGWTQDEAMGKPITDVFNIYNEKTGGKVESPSSSAIREGTLKHLAPNTQLMNRGKEWIPISHSASPIKDTEGSIIGAVIIFQDTTERDKAEKVFKVFVKELQRSNEALREFAVHAAHDLKEPLRKIITYGDRLKTSLAPSISGQDTGYLDRLQSSARKMQELIDQLLELSMISDKPPNFVPTNLNDIVESVLDDLEIRIEKTDGKVKVHSLPTLEAEPFQMQRLFKNLISNALKFHKKEEAPVVTLTGQLLDNGFWEIRIEDNGIGFDEKHLNRLFKPFERLHRPSEYEGTGMGTAICQKILDLHDGTITAKSVPGKGSTFIVTLPSVERKNKQLSTVD